MLLTPSQAWTRPPKYMWAHDEVYELQAQAAKYTYPAIARRQAKTCMGEQKQSAATWVYRALGASIAIGIMELLAGLAGEALWRVPFVTSIVLVMALPTSKPAQSRSIVGGHLFRRLRSALLLAVRSRRDIERCRCRSRDLRYDCPRSRPSARRHRRFSRSCSPAARPLAL